MSHSVDALIVQFNLTIDQLHFLGMEIKEGEFFKKNLANQMDVPRAALFSRLGPTGYEGQVTPGTRITSKLRSCNYLFWLLYTVIHTAWNVFGWRPYLYTIDLKQIITGYLRAVGFSYPKLERNQCEQPSFLWVNRRPAILHEGQESLRPHTSHTILQRRFG